MRGVRGLRPVGILVSVVILASASLPLLGALLRFKPPVELELLLLFAVTALSHATIVARDVFIPLLLSLAPRHSPFALGLASGLGGSLGNLALYHLGRGFTSSAGGGWLEAWMRRYGLLAVLLVSATPLPDTPVILLSGSGGLPMGRVLLAQWAGKSILYSLGAMVGGFILEGLSGVVGGPYASALVVASSIILCILASWMGGREGLYRLLRRLLP